MAIALETQEKAKEIILEGLRAQPHGSVRFCDIHATVRLNAIDEEFLDTRAIYEGPYKDLNMRKLVALHDEIRSQLIEIGILHVPSVSYLPKAEYDRLLSETAMEHPYGRQV